MSSIEVKVVQKIREAEDIFCFELASTDGKSLPPFSAGAHIDVHVNDSVTRQYSLCNDASLTHHYLIGVLRDPGSRGGSSALHDKVAEGDTLKISEPKNHFPLVTARKTLLFAGGIGVTPILCMAERLALISADFEMHYCTRSIERTAFLKRIKSSSFSDRVHFHFDTGDDTQKLQLQALLRTPEPDTHIYVCGPGGFIEYVVGTAKAMHWAEENVHLECFGAAPVDTLGDQAFRIQVASTGDYYTVPPSRTVVQVLEENGIDIPVSCEQGVCGTCITRVLCGTPDHRDMYFTDEERDKNDQFTPCCSRAKTAELVLDL
ncbi:PDR/VanB family oxidoreductase [Noviherbaspirillum saxi]|uniref:Oxidoreductase n=1 Tax=Noviherbaspirillum saxi TaxID=2320863 RepID=A0A3A3FHY4_9BURK|nr:PDR/VanB family oxidoreductase [Noviherbaspirillum saxi]RJF95118.1 oxidoreductase [Noviherbaspirillum saxi]